MSEKKRDLTPQVPGQAVAEPVVIEPVIEAVADEPIAVAPAAPVAATKAAKKGFDEQGIAHAAKGRTPEPHEVDPRLIKRATLTTQGYIVPVK